MGQPAAAPFLGPQTVADVASIDAFVARARPGERLIYCSAPDLIRGAASSHVRNLAQEGYVSPTQERRAGGGFNFLIERSSRALPSAVARAAPDEAMDAIYRAMCRAANFGFICPSDAEMARIAGLDTRDQANWRVRKLVAAGKITSLVATEDGVPVRVVTVVATAKSTALPPKWRAAQLAAEADARSLPPVGGGASHRDSGQ